jgi:hypothetical protein
MRRARSKKKAIIATCATAVATVCVLAFLALATHITSVAAQPGYAWQAGCHCSPPTTAPKPTTTTAAKATTTTALQATTTTRAPTTTTRLPTSTAGSTVTTARATSTTKSSTATTAISTSARSVDSSTASSSSGEVGLPTDAGGVAALAGGLQDSTTSTSLPGSGDVPVGPTAGAPVQLAPRSVNYYVSPIAIAFLMVYILSFGLYKTKRMRFATHRKIWNVLLLATFMITGVMGLVLAVRLTYAAPFVLPFNLLFWHVEAGIAMTLISIFHLSWHMSYYAGLVRRRNGAAVRLEAVRERNRPDRRAVWAESSRKQQRSGLDHDRERRRDLT